MRLAELLEALPRSELRGDADIDIGSIEYDSRRVGGGEMFVCLEGLARNGHDFAAAAVAKGAVALTVTHPIPEVSRTTQVVVPDTREAMARFAAAFFSHPARSLKVVGVTGTNGKTTVTHLVQAVAETAGHMVDVMGTLGTRVGGSYRSTGFTTPESPEVQRLLRESADRGAAWVAMEVSSHALAQKRTFATDFAIVVFTNLTQDHLDYHGDMETYFEAKARLFEREGRGSESDATAIVNLEDPAGKRLASRAEGKVVTYGLGTGVDYRARRLRTETGGTRYELVTPRGKAEVKLALLGRFNVLNALAAQAAAMELGVPLDEAVTGVESVTRIPGRMELMAGTQPFLVVIDFAHTPDALARALQEARGFTSGALTVVFGCGGDRDRDKRPRMGEVAGQLADRVVVTSDNPRGEDPNAIIEEILEGIPPGTGPALQEADRALAIRLALERAEVGDTVLVAGKGHETYQQVGDETLPFDDRRVTAEILREIGFDVDDPNHVV
jgi:UDP-N-acetylmuramoyl-L-alanyl-D-glutamate--2,6-diaminopimelate ligase